MIRRRPTQLTRRRALFLVTFVLVVAWCARWAAATGPLSTLESDEAIPGLMSLRILQGDRPVFYWGQPYLGAIEMYLTAAVFSLGGVSTLTFKFVPIVSSLLFVVTLYQVGKQWFGRSVGILSSAFASVSLLLVVRGVKGTGYGPVLVLGNLALWQLALLWRSRADLASRAVLIRWACLGVTCGLMFWAHPMGIAYVVSVALFLCQCLAGWMARYRSAWSRALGTVGLASALFLAGCALGMAPLIAENSRSGWQTFQLLGGSGLPSSDWVARLVEFRASLPIVLGLFQPTSYSDGFWESVARNRVAFWLGLLIGTASVLWAVAAIAIAGWRLARFRQVEVGWVLPATFLLVCLLAIASRFSSFTEPRYLLPVFSCLPFFIGSAGKMANRIRPSLSRRALHIGLTLIVAANITGLLSINPSLNLPYLDRKPYPVDLTAVVSYLRREGIGEVYADYWICYRLMFETRERVNCAVVNGLNTGWNRRWEYAAAVDNSPSPGWVFVDGSVSALEFANRLDSEAIAHSRDNLGGYVVYSKLERRLAPSASIPWQPEN